MKEFKWSRSEKIVARQAYDRAYERECTEILNKVKGMLSEMKEPKEIWKVKDYLDKKRIGIEAKYDYRYSVLIVVFGRLMREGLIEDSDIQGLDQDKIDTIKRIGSYRI